MQSDLNSFHEPHAYTLSSCEVLLDECPEARQVVLVGPQVWELGITRRPTIEMFLFQMIMSVVQKGWEITPSYLLIFELFFL